MGFLLLAGSLPVCAEGYSLRFHGFGGDDVDRVKIPAAGVHELSPEPGPPVDVGASDFTLEFWVRGRLEENTAPGTACGFGPDWIYGNVLFDRSQWEPGGRSFGLSLGAGRLSFGVTNEARESRTICGNTMILDGVWHHVAVQRRLLDGRISIYVDGALDARDEGPDGDLSYPPAGRGGLDKDPYLVIGAEKRDAGPSFPSFHGWIDEVRFSSSLRYAGSFAPPSEPFVPDEETVALYHFDEGAGERVIDSARAAGGPSHGLRRFGGSPVPGPEWSRETPFGTVPAAPAPFAGMPQGAVLEAYPNAALSQTIFYARFPEPRTGEVTVTIHDGEGRIRSELVGTLQDGSAMFIWDGKAADGSQASAGSYSATLQDDAGSLSTRFVLR
jgi:hypothetical protein